MWQRRCQVLITGKKSEREVEPVFWWIVTFFLSPQILFFLSSFWCSDSLPTTYITCSLMRLSIFVKIAAECVCNILIFLVKLNPHFQIIIFFNWGYFSVAVYFCNVGRNKTCFFMPWEVLCIYQMLLCHIFALSNVMCVYHLLCLQQSSKSLLQCSIHVDLTSQNIC